MNYKIVVADDHYPTRKSFALLLANEKHIKVCAETANGIEALQAVEKHKPDILILDLQMPVMDGFMVLEKLQTAKADVKTIVFTGFSNEQNLAKCAELGACGILSKDYKEGEELKAIESVMQTGFYYTQATHRIFQKQAGEIKKLKPHFNDDTIHFSEIEMKVVYFYCCGLSNDETGDKINLNKRTVEGIKSRMMEKIKVARFMSVLIYCHQKRLIDLDSIPLSYAA